MKEVDSSHNKPRSWGDIVGPVFHQSDLAAELQRSSNLVVLETAQGTKVCPAFQFDSTEKGLRVNPHIGLAWQFLTSLQIDQLGESAWTVAGMLTQTRPDLDGQSWAELLRRNDLSDQQKLPVYAAIVGDAVYASEWSGTPLIDPRTILGR